MLNARHISKVLYQCSRLKSVPRLQNFSSLSGNDNVEVNLDRKSGELDCIYQIINMFKLSRNMIVFIRTALSITKYKEDTCVPNFCIVGTNSNNVLTCSQNGFLGTDSVYVCLCVCPK